MYIDKLVYKVVIWVFLGYFMKREGSFNLVSVCLYAGVLGEQSYL